MKRNPPPQDADYLCPNLKLCDAVLQLAKQQKADEQQDAERSAAPGLADGNAASAALRAAAGEAARVGDVGASQQRFRDPECFIPDQKASRYEEKDFAVNRDKDAMASAVLDLQQDDAVSVTAALHIVPS